MCPNCLHFMCDLEEVFRFDGETMIHCHKCDKTKPAIDWSDLAVRFYVQEELNLRNPNTRASH